MDPLARADVVFGQFPESTSVDVFIYHERRIDRRLRQATSHTLLAFVLSNVRMCICLVLSAKSASNVGQSIESRAFIRIVARIESSYGWLKKKTEGGRGEESKKESEESWVERERERVYKGRGLVYSPERLSLIDLCNSARRVFIARPMLST